MNRRKGVLPIFLFMLVFATWILWAMNAVAQTWQRPGVSAGCYHTVGLKTDGTVVGVGYNNYGELNVDSWTDIVQVSAGGGVHTVGLKANGTVVAVGYNYYGILNVDSWTDIVQVSAGGQPTDGL